MGSQRMESRARKANRRKQLDICNEPSRETARNVVTVVLPQIEFFTRRRKPTPTPVFKTYWRFAKRRQEVFFQRLQSSSHKHDVADAIIARFRFTNVYRASDRVSQYLIRKVQYDQDWSADDLVFRTLIFKFFNKIETWEALQSAVGVICWDNYDFDRYDQHLSAQMEKGEKIYSAAYIMPSGRSAFGYRRKHQNHLRIIEAVIRGGVAERITEQSNFEPIYRLLRQYPCIGPFIGYQYAIDLNYSPLIHSSENEFVEPGPGAVDGIHKCFSDLGDYSPADIIHYMVDVQEDAFARFAPDFRDLWGRRLQLIDCQNLFCEVDKYARVAHPDVNGRSKRRRIKQTYKPNPVPRDPPWYPPNWGINEAVVRSYGAPA